MEYAATALAAHLAVPLGAVAQAIQREGADVPIGAVETSGRRFNVEATGPFDSLDEIRNVVLRSVGATTVKVGDVATVEWTNDERVHIARFNGQESVGLLIFKDAGENAVRVAERILEFTTQIRVLKELLPICMYCKRIRDDSDYWQQVESYIHTHTGSNFSHGICPDCFQKEMHVYPKKKGLTVTPQ